MLCFSLLSFGEFKRWFCLGFFLFERGQLAVLSCPKISFCGFLLLQEIGQFHAFASSLIDSSNFFAAQGPGPQGKIIYVSPEWELIFSASILSQMPGHAAM
jgi:hypothetical protein